MAKETPAQKKAREAREAETRRRKSAERAEEKGVRRLVNLGRKVTGSDKRRKNDQRGRHRE